MALSWLDPAQPDQRDLAGAVAVLEAARAVETPHLIEETVSALSVLLRLGTAGDPPALAVTHDPSGRVIGVLRAHLPRWDNTHLANLQVVVDPQERRHGLGRRLFEAGVEHVRAAGRRVVCSVAFDQTAGIPFLKAMGGMDPVLEEVFRRLDVRAMDWPRLDQESAAAEQLATGYELVRLRPPLPEELLPAISAMTEAINDAPTDGLALEDSSFPPERIRAYERYEAAAGHRRYRLLARERSTGALAGHTVVSVNGDRPWFAGQQGTSVVRAHRGHRLGLLLKIGMLRWLREEEPQLRVVLTGNAASNAHMIRVNDVLGYEVVARTVEFQRHL